MKISCLPVSFYQEIMSGRMKVSEWAVLASQVGLDAIDLSVLLVRNRTPVYLEKLRDELVQTGMPVTMVTSYQDFTHPDRIQRERELAYCIGDIAMASQLNAAYLRITAGQSHEQPNELNEDETLDTVADYFYKAKKWADQFGVKLVYENHSKPGAWLHPDYLFDTVRFLRLAEKLKNSGIRINFDTANTFAYGDDPIPVFKKVLPLVETIHVSDVAAKNSLQFTTIGTGVAPVEEILLIARNSGFNGWLCIEEASFTGMEGVRRAVEFVRKTWAKS
jgi:sugar phosphate isomerase/epimerase